jgi:hypothetical protein
MRKWKNIYIFSLVGLDPAGPLFNGDDARVRLDKSDTLFMDNIHTNAQVLGIGQSVGHVDFYPNKGGRQPMCNDGMRAQYIIYNSLALPSTCFFGVCTQATATTGYAGITSSCR